MLGSATATAGGALLASGLIIPQHAAPGGIGLVIVRAEDGTLVEPADTPFAVTPLIAGLTVSPSLAVPGTSVTVTGNGFVPGTAVQLRLFDGSLSVPIHATDPLTSTGTGAIGPISVTIPPIITAPSGSDLAILSAVDAGGTTASAPMTIVDSRDLTGTLSLEPSRAVLGGAVYVSGTGFLPNEPIDLTLTGGSSAGVLVQSFMASAAPPTAPGGSFSGSALAADSNGAVSGVFAVPLTGNTVRNDIPGTTSSSGTLVTVSLRGRQSGTTIKAPLVIGAPWVRTDSIRDHAGPSIHGAGGGLCLRRSGDHCAHRRQ